MDCFAEFPDVATTIGRGDTKMSVRLNRGLQVDLRVVDAESFGAALQYFTGSKEHNVILRGRAKQLGLKINEYGVYRLDSDKSIAGRTEEEVYAALNLPTFPPELREAGRSLPGRTRASCRHSSNWTTSTVICTCTPTPVTGRPLSKKWSPPPKNAG